MNTGKIIQKHQCFTIYFKLMTFPFSLPDARTIISDVLGSIEFNFYHHWFDVIFLVSGIVSMVFLYFVHQANKSNAMLSRAVTSQGELSPLTGGSNASNGQRTSYDDHYTTSRRNGVNGGLYFRG